MRLKLSAKAISGVILLRMRHYVRIPIPRAGFFVAITAIGGPAAGLNISDAVGLGSENPKERLRAHGAGADLDIVRLLNDAAAV